MSNTFFTSDSHYGHKNVLKYCNRPFDSIEEHDEHLIEMWNKTVRPKDAVWHLGDFAFGDFNKALTILHRLNGTINLIRGNHDYKAPKYLLDEFPSINDLKQIKIGQTKIVMTHYSLRTWNAKKYGSWNLFGHSHGMLPVTSNDKALDVGVDNIKTLFGDYRPVSYQEIKQILEK